MDLDERAIQKKFAGTKGISGNGWTLPRAKALARLLSESKRAAAENELQAGELVLGCDQLVMARGQIFGKPGTHANAKKMLRGFSGEKIWLINSMSLGCMNVGARHVSRQRASFVLHDLQVIEMRFASLEDSEIERVLKLDTPYEAAGSFHFESHGANLLKSVICDDPTGIQGLPVMRLRSMIEMLKQRASAGNL